MAYVICLYCNERFNREKEETVKVGRRYVHKKCMEKRQETLSNSMTPTKQKAIIEKEAIEKEIDKTISKKNLRKCFYCSQDVDISNQENYRMARVNRYAHTCCYNRFHVDDDDYIDKIYSVLKEQHIKYDYQACEKQRLSYMAKLGYTNEGMWKDLKYFYEIKKMSSEKSGNRIGIIPYVYDEAKVYYEALEMKQKQVKKDIEHQLKQKHKIIHIKAEEKKIDKGYIDLKGIVGD